MCYPSSSVPFNPKNSAVLFVLAVAKRACWYFSLVNSGLGQLQSIVLGSKSIFSTFSPRQINPLEMWMPITTESFLESPTSIPLVLRLLPSPIFLPCRWQSKLSCAGKLCLTRHVSFGFAPRQIKQKPPPSTPGLSLRTFPCSLCGLRDRLLNETGYV